jgi:FkbM family methyltransferase
MKKIGIKVLRKFKILNRLRLSPSITVENTKIVIPIINGVGIGNFLHLSEPWMQHVLKILIKRKEFSNTFIDVGVNVGQTLIKVKAIAPSIKYIGFEPNALCINYVNTLISTNKFINTEIIPVGISDKTQVVKLKLFSASDVDSAASIVDNFRDEAAVKKTLYVPVFKYSDIPRLEDLTIGILKIDVEGAEYEVIKGFKDQIQADRPLILMEILPAYSSDNSIRISRQEKIQKLLTALSYTILRVIKEENQFIGVQQLAEFGIHSDLNLCEYILTPSEITDSIKTELGKTS